MLPKPGDVLDGDFWPEPVRVLKVQVSGSRVKIEAVGIRTQHFFPRILSMDDLNRVRVSTETGRDFTGRAEVFFLAVEGHRARYAYPHILSDMKPVGGSPNASSTSADLTDSVLATGVKSGYKFTFNVVASDPAGKVLSYSITASPVIPGTSGQLFFYTDQSGVIRASTGGSADSSSTPIE